MTVNIEDLKDRIQTLVMPGWTVRTDTANGPEIWDAHNIQIAVLDVGYAVWTCTDEQDGCPETSREAIALAKLLVDLPGYALELIEAVERLQDTVESLEEELEEVEHGFQAIT